MEMLLLLYLLMMIAFLLATVFWVWMIVDCAQNEPPGNDKIVWIIIIVFTHWIGALLYYFVRRPNRPTFPQSY
jgi:Phospholipase_D-nuclease N-terminal